MTKRRKRKAKACTSLPGEPTLDDILKFLHGRDGKMLLARTVIDGAGRIDRYATALGQRTYRKLVELLYAVGGLTGSENEVEHMVMQLDDEVRHHGM